METDIQEQIPQELICPITQVIFQQPVVATDGHTYEKAQIELWFTLHNISPLTGVPLQSKLLIPNHTLKKAVYAYLQKNPLLLRARQQKADRQIALKLSQLDIQDGTPLSQKHPLFKQKMEIENQKKLQLRQKQCSFRKNIQLRQRQLQRQRTREEQIKQAIARQKVMQAKLRAQQNKTKKMEQRIKREAPRFEEKIEANFYKSKYEQMEHQVKPNQEFLKSMKFTKKVQQNDKFKSDLEQRIQEEQCMFDKKLTKVHQQRNRQIEIVRSSLQSKQKINQMIQAISYRYQDQQRDMQRRHKEKVARLEEQHQRKIRIGQKKVNKVQSRKQQMKDALLQSKQKIFDQKLLRKQQKQQKAAKQLQEKRIRQQEKQRRIMQRKQIQMQKEAQKLQAKANKLKK